MPNFSAAGIAYDRRDPGSGVPIVLLHAGIADRRMWNGVLHALATSHDVVTLDLRGFGDSVTPPVGTWSPRADVLGTLDALGVARAHLVGCSFGAGVAVEVALERPTLAASLVLAAPGGALLTERTDQLTAFFAAEASALEQGDLAAAADANVRTWIDGSRPAGAGPPEIREAVWGMQLRAFEITAGWAESVWEAEDGLVPPATDRLAEVTAPTLIVTGDLDVDAIGLTADHLQAQLPHVRRERWPGVVHLPPMERPAAFAAAVLGHVAEAPDV